MKNLLLLLTLTCTSVIYAQDNIDYQRVYLSGKDVATPVDWEFKVSDGRKSGKWSRIPVPSNWEQHGFGTYNYGHDHANDKRVLGKEMGFYKHGFSVPHDWKGKVINIVFAGSMTDTEVKVNGQQAGPIHQGAFYEFRYDIGDLLEYGKKNLLKVKVAKHSENASINRAERQADFWIFGGIFRPVYLEVLPENHFSRIAVDARASGKFNVLLELNKPVEAAEVKVKIVDPDTDRQVKEFTASLDSTSSVIEEHIENVASWNPENPKCYNAEFTLFVEGKPVYTKTEHIGFRTVELRENDGFYVNGTKVVFKGVNRHSFYPTTGRALSETNHLEDISLIKEMNMNAVRMSHYPPDERFLDLCDSLGLFVLDEVTGWQDGYDTIAGPKLIKETILKGENHPSVVVWDHGNEGGWTFANEKWFHHWDIQKRPVIYPWLNRNGVDTFHYPVYKAGINRLSNGQDVFMPTEMLHGLYDGGHGAGLDDFWTDYMKNPRAAGGFLWSFADEALLRTDRSDSLDADGNHAPDGIVGPFREKEGSFYTIRDIWSPIQIKQMVINSRFDGKLILQNHYLYTDLEGMSLNWELKILKDWKGGTLHTGSVKLKSTLPGESSRTILNLPEDFTQADWLEVQITDHHGRVVNTWSWPVHTPSEFAANKIKNAIDPEKQSVSKTEGDELVFQMGTIKAYFDKNSYVLKRVENAGQVFPFSGPVSLKDLRPEKVNIEDDGQGNYTIEIHYDEYPGSVKWTLLKNGLIKLEAEAFRGHTAEEGYAGIHFDFPEEQVRGVEWLGNGPYRVWQNRMRGARFGFWQKDYNNTITGYSTKEKLEYPEFKGYHAGMYAYRLSTQKGNFSVYTETSGLFFRLFTPAESPHITDGLRVSFPPGGLSFLQKIPAIGTKFHAAEFMGPQSGNPRNVGHNGDGLEGIKLYFDFR